jgi:hypothetical protein
MASGETFTIEDWTVSVNEDSDVTVHGITYGGTEGLWEILN